MCIASGVRRLERIIYLQGLLRFASSGSLGLLRRLCRCESLLVRVIFEWLVSQRWLRWCLSACWLLVLLIVIIWLILILLSVFISIVLLPILVIVVSVVIMIIHSTATSEIIHSSLILVWSIISHIVRILVLVWSRGGFIIPVCCIKEAIWFNLPSSFLLEKFISPFVKILDEFSFYPLNFLCGKYFPIFEDYRILMIIILIIPPIPFIVLLWCFISPIRLGLRLILDIVALLVRVPICPLSMYVWI